MIGTIGDTIWMGLGIALNPIAIVISILVANRAEPKRNGLALVLGWILGLAVLVALPAFFLYDRFTLPNGVQETLAGRFSLFRAVLGVLLLIAAAVAVARGPLPGDHAADPRWLRIIDRGGVGRMFGMGAFLSIVNFRNLVLLAAAASVIGQAALDDAGIFLMVALFVAIATLGVLIPLLIHLFGGEASESRLQAWADWLTRHMGMITGVIMALFGILLLTRGLQGAF
jgi:hypothetical protein